MIGRRLVKALLLLVASAAASFASAQTGDVEVSPTSLELAEDGTSTFTLGASEAPDTPNGGFRVAISSDDTSVATVNRASQDFVANTGQYNTWDNDRTITVTAVGLGTATIGLSVSNVWGSPTNYNTSIDVTDVSVIVGAKYVIYKSGVDLTEKNLEVPEDGSIGTFLVSLPFAPNASHTVNVTSSDTGEATVSPATLTFTTSNWNTRQLVTVTGVNDNTTGHDSATITMSSDSGNDAGDAIILDAVVNVTLQDDDAAAGVTLSATSLNIGGSDTTATYTMVLDKQPAGQGNSRVYIELTSSDTSIATVSPDFLHSWKLETATNCGLSREPSGSPPLAAVP